MWKLTSENLTSLSRMGSSTTTNYEKYFKSKTAAMKFAEEEYGKPFKWNKNSDGSSLSSPDLMYVMYFIKPVITED